MAAAWGAWLLPYDTLSLDRVQQLTRSEHLSAPQLAWAWALVCLLATMLHAARDVLTRAIPPTVPSVMVTLATAATVTLLAGTLSLFEGWRAVTSTQLALLATASVFLSGGYYFVILGMREGDVSVISPFRYTSLVYALLIGWAASPSSSTTSRV